MKNAAIILAGGVGKRFGGDTPKQFIKLGNKLVIEYSIEKFYKIVDVLVIVSHPNYIGDLKAKYKLMVVEGGNTRQLSVKNGLESLSDKEINYVAIHDSARPFVSLGLLEKMFQIVQEKKAVIPVITSSSSVCRIKDNLIEEYIPRESISFIQTPQVFDYNLIYNAHKKAFEEGRFDFTDDSQLVNFIGEKVSVITGEETNIKITTRFDLGVAETLIKKGFF